MEIAFWSAGLLIAFASGAWIARFVTLRKAAAAANDAFLIHYYRDEKRTWFLNTRWLGCPVLKLPFDLWIYQEILYEVQPDLIVETGTYHGGSALYLASVLDLLQKGRVVTIDRDVKKNAPRHPRLNYVSGSSTAEETLNQVRGMIRAGDTVMVILDSDHSKDHVLEECRLYGPLVTKGSYMIVEDTCVNGHPLLPDFGAGPMEAIDEFLPANPQFQIDPSREKFGATFNPRGYLRRVK